MANSFCSSSKIGLLRWLYQCLLKQSIVVNISCNTQRYLLEDTTIDLKVFNGALTQAHFAYGLVPRESRFLKSLIRRFRALTRQKTAFAG